MTWDLGCLIQESRLTPDVGTTQHFLYRDYNLGLETHLGFLMN